MSCWTYWMQNHQSAVWCASFVWSQLSLYLAFSMFSIIVYKCLVSRVRVLAEQCIRIGSGAHPPICLYALVCLLGNNRHGRFVHLCLGPMLIILGAITPFGIRLHIVLFNDNFAIVFIYLCKNWETRVVVNSVLWEQRWGAAHWVTNEFMQLFSLQQINLLVAFNLLNSMRTSD